MPAFTLARSITIDAPIDKVFTSLRDFRQWPAWSPWLITEPDAELTFSDDGSSYTWHGKYIGAGEMAIDRLEENRSLAFNLSFIKPWKGKATSRFDLAEDDGGTKVTWSMVGSLPFFLFFLKKLMANLCGSDYDRGLSMLKEYLETGKVSAHLAFATEHVDAVTIVGVQGECAISEINESMDEAAKRAARLLEGMPCGPAASVYHKWDISGMRAKYSFGRLLETVPTDLPEGLVTIYLPATQAYTVTHTGPYHYIGNAWSAGMSRSRSGAFKLKKSIDCYEIYENDPEVTPPEELITKVIFPMK